MRGIFDWIEKSRSAYVRHLAELRRNQVRLRQGFGGHFFAEGEKVVEAAGIEPDLAVFLTG
jgi:hypothetical protein